MNVFGKFEELLRIIFRTQTGNHNVTVEPSSSTSQDQTFTLPETSGATDTVVARASNDQAGNRLTNKDLDDASTRISDGANTTRFDLTNTGSATAELPDIADTQTDRLVARDTADTLTNKSLTSPELTGSVTGDAVDTDLAAGPNLDTKLASALAAQTYVDSVSGDVQSNLDDHIADATDAHDSTAITYDPTGDESIAPGSTNVDAAISDLDTNKLDRDGSQTMTGPLNMGNQDIGNIDNIEINNGGNIDTDAAGSLDIGPTSATSVNIGNPANKDDVLNRTVTTVYGELRVDGTQTIVNTETLAVEDENISVNVGGDQASADDIAGLTVEMSDADNAQLIYNKDVESKWEAGDATSRSEILTSSDSQFVANKSLDSTTTEVQDTADPTKKLKLDVTGVTTATTRTQVIQDVDDTFVMRDTADTLQNKTIDGNFNTISNLVHGVEVDDPTSGVHGVTGDVVGTTDAQTLTDKTLEEPTINTTASGTAIETDLINNTPISETNRLASEKAIVDFVNNQVSGVAGGSGSGEINYITNPTFNTDASDWTTYKALSTPPAAGLTANGNATEITFIRSTDYIIEGTASGRLQKSTANSAIHEGISTDFSIPAGQQRRATKVKLSFFTADTAAYGKLEVYLVRDPNGTPTVELLPGEFLAHATPDSNTKKYEFNSSFFPEDEEHRLVIHISTATASSFTYYFDSVVVGPEEASLVRKESFDNLVKYPGGTNLDGWNTYNSGSVAPGTFGNLQPVVTGGLNLVRGTNPTRQIDDYATMNLSWSGASLGQGAATELTVPKNHINRLLTVEFDYYVGDNPSSLESGEVRPYLVGEDNTVIELADMDLTGTADVDNIINYRDTVVLPTNQRWKLGIHRTTNAASSITIAMSKVYIGVGAPGSVATGFDGIWKTYDENDVTITSTQGGFGIYPNGLKLIPTKDTEGNWWLEIFLSAFHNTTPTTQTITIPGAEAVLTTLGADEHQLSIGTPGIDWAAARAVQNGSGGTTIDIGYSAANGRTRLFGKFQLTGKPTWADFDPPVNVMSDNVVFANRRSVLTGNSGTLSTPNTSRQLVEYDVLEAGDLDYSAGIWTSPYDGLVRVRAQVSTAATIGANGSSLLIKLNNQDQNNNTGEIIRNVQTNTQFFQIEADIPVVKGDQLSIHWYNFSGGTQNLTNFNTHNRVSFVRVADYSAGQPVGFGIAENSRPGLIKSYDEGTFTFTTFGTANLSGTASYQTGYWTRIGNRVFCNMDFISGLSMAASNTRTFLEVNVTGLPEQLNTTYINGTLRVKGSSGNDVTASIIQSTTSASRLALIWTSNGTGALTMDGIGFSYRIADQVERGTSEMNHDELKHDITARIDRLEDDLRAQLNGVDSKLDELMQDVIKSTTKNTTRLDVQSGQIKLLWTAFLTLVSGVATYILNIKHQEH